jgi:signal transduction histidine kinase
MTIPCAAPLPPPPWVTLRTRLLERADRLARDGDADAAQALRAIVESWWTEQQSWNAIAAGLLGVHHDINNALVGVSGSAQLLQLGPAGREPGVRERLDTVIRESQRIRDAVQALPPLRAVFRVPARDATGTGAGR